MAVTDLIEVMKRFSPMDGMKPQNLAALVKKTKVEKLEAGETLFSLDDKDKRSIFLARGTVELTTENDSSVKVKAGSPEAANALSPHLPRQQTAVAVDDITYLTIDTDLLDVMLTWDQTGHFEVEHLTVSPHEVQEDKNWMSTLMQIKAFTMIPPANIQAIFMRMEQVQVKQGQVVIKQGDPGDYFYAITRGEAAVVRETALNKEGVRLAELGPGDTFGEEALITEATRNATVTMLTNGSVMRLGADDFRKLLNEPMLDWIDYQEALDAVADGAKWLDIRLPSEFDSYHESNAMNMPLYFIRLKISALDPDTTYIVCCDTGRRSSAGAFILNERGFTTKVLRGGLNTNQLSLASD